MARIKVRKGMPSVQLTKARFAERLQERFYDPAFAPLQAELARIVDVAWDGYDNGRKAPRTHPAGSGFADPQYALSDEWRAARDAVRRAEQRQRSPASKSRILLINGSPRSEHTCPGEMSKIWRLVEIARGAIARDGRCETEILDLSRLASEHGRRIHPCKACFSTAAALCHWPCSCYPNHSLGQTSDWMNDIYPMWVAAHGVMIITPVHWYQVSSPLKLMMDRLVCADGGNPDPTRTHGKDAAKAKRIELAGWDYPRHLAGRLFAVVAHGDAEGAENVRRALADWMSSIGMHAAGSKAELDRYVGYWKPYATSHADLDADVALQQEVANVATTLAQAVTAQRQGALVSAGEQLKDPRQK